MWAQTLTKMHVYHMVLFVVLSQKHTKVSNATLRVLLRLQTQIVFFLFFFWAYPDWFVESLDSKGPHEMRHLQCDSSQIGEGDTYDDIKGYWSVSVRHGVKDNLTADNSLWTGAEMNCLLILWAMLLCRQSWSAHASVLESRITSVCSY